MIQENFIKYPDSEGVELSKKFRIVGYHPEQGLILSDGAGLWTFDSLESFAFKDGSDVPFSQKEIALAYSKTKSFWKPISEVYTSVEKKPAITGPKSDSLGIPSKN